KIGKNEDGASIIPDSVKTNNNRITSDLHDATPNNKKPANANNTNVSSSQNTKSGKIAHKSNQLIQVNYLLDIDKKQNPFLRQIVNSLLSSKVHLTYLRLKKATKNQIRVIKNQISTLKELINQVSKSFVESKVKFIINNNRVKTDALNYLIAIIKKKIVIKSLIQKLIEKCMKQVHTKKNIKFGRNIKEDFWKSKKSRAKKRIYPI